MYTSDNNFQQLNGMQLSVQQPGHIMTENYVPEDYTPIQKWSSTPLEIARNNPVEAISPGIAMQNACNYGFVSPKLLYNPTINGHKKVRYIDRLGADTFTQQY